ncbi:hypothetical protein SAMD00019534_066290 [Acytostelium subglobosum LB1]|uniref:hypothetical protein n=1 Tax=Acytostelium subglobosum LB1 TaxID=1410327 RepID=UPI000645142D|nr:hypothetical protein SAMD00019534_066290 [Acytostelium subglobosum LB1]GAM23454.1 hypothetical protein SAMD00019534_066290 [Acytostelium subglobosum LB1]|eukprot:XP_012753903.1 hypothetical protein SAMD00019534_066290 [Acytostelium subglobosum LB1]
MYQHQQQQQHHQQQLQQHQLQQQQYHYHYPHYQFHSPPQQQVYFSVVGGFMDEYPHNSSSSAPSSMGGLSSYLVNSKEVPMNMAMSMPLLSSMSSSNTYPTVLVRASSSSSYQSHSLSSSNQSPTGHSPVESEDDSEEDIGVATTGNIIVKKEKQHRQHQSQQPSQQQQLNSSTGIEITGSDGNNAARLEAELNGSGSDNGGHSLEPEPVAKKRGRPRKKKPECCLRCGVTDTPEWRRGPDNIELCNACGIQSSKALKKEKEIKFKHSMEFILNGEEKSIGRSMGEPNTHISTFGL